MRTYHIGLSKRKKTLIIEAQTSVDCLDCEIYDYMGEREITKKKLRENRMQILAEMQKQRPQVYSGLKYAKVV